MNRNYDVRDGYLTVELLTRLSSSVIISVCLDMYRALSYGMATERLFPK